MPSKSTQRATTAPQASSVGFDLAGVVQSVLTELPGDESPWRVWVRDHDGAPFASFTLRSYEQVLLFEERMEGFGYGMLMLDQRFRQCDFAVAQGVRGA